MIQSSPDSFLEMPPGQFLFIAEDRVDLGGDLLAAGVDSANEILRNPIGLETVMQPRGPFPARLGIVAVTIRNESTSIPGPVDRRRRLAVRGGRNSYTVSRAFLQRVRFHHEHPGRPVVGTGSDSPAAIGDEIAGYRFGHWRRRIPLRLTSSILQAKAACRGCR